MRTLEQRLWSKVSPEPNSGCWLWEGGQDHRGYGSIKYANVHVHRVAYEIWRGPIPPSREEKTRDAEAGRA